ncbi:thiamine pyrophosphate-binding protein [Clostridium sp. YIM B02506]|uniref:alpha-keto acid decarboxylase family protein n=1 Tax=Clostridium sp. YIM B02506 TaxID=2910680 RepID=UPI001EEE0877|nr:thiamine pyrophosphate-binding protein [Clostridium sp. YIM B02506]
MKSIGEYLFDCLSKEGITEIFGVPGDYNFTLLNTLEKYSTIKFIDCRNELNAGYAADAYGRVKGISALITTFGVGELSACNAIAGSYSEYVPVIHIVGAPKSMMQKEHKQMHHTLLDGNFDVFKKIYEQITEYSVIITAENAKLEIPTAIEKAKSTKKPVYLLIATDFVDKPIINRDSYIQQSQTDIKNLESAITHINEIINKAQNPLLISGIHVLRYNLKDYVQKIVKNLNIPVATMMMGKGSFDESHNNFIGLYAGSLGDKQVQNMVESSDCLLSIGTMWSDYNTGSFTAKLNPVNIIEIQPSYVKVGMTVYENILMEDLLKEFTLRINKKVTFFNSVSFPYNKNIPSLNETVSSEYYYTRFQEMLKAGDIVVADAGTLQYGISQIRLPKDVTYITQGGWGSIGYGVPAAFGACIADKNRRLILFAGDGSAQMTAQELSSMLINNCKPIIFLINNKEYTIEKYLNIGEYKAHYNDIPSWDFSKLIEAFGGNFFSAKVYTNKELDDTIKQVEKECSNKLCLVEIFSPQMDAPPMVHKMTNMLEQMQ